MIDIHAKISSEFFPHPFSQISHEADHHVILSNFLAMSQAFPYLQAGSQRDLIQYYISRNEDVPEHVELTSVVGNFLCWDETGGFYLSLASGLKGLPRILETRRFHSNLLKKDLLSIFKKEIKPDYSCLTREYLDKLSRGLSALCPIERVAYMVGFEIHANEMITALWDFIADKYPVDKNKLAYFYTHVGGDQPAEEHHVTMTNNLIGKIVPQDRLQEFESLCLQAYQLNYDWCRALSVNKEVELAH
jgi:hypothetical protein